MFRCGFRSFVCLANENHRVLSMFSDFLKAQRPSCHDDENQAECAESIKDFSRDWFDLASADIHETFYDAPAKELSMGNVSKVAWATTTAQPLSERVKGDTWVNAWQLLDLALGRIVHLKKLQDKEYKSVRATEEAALWKRAAAYQDSTCKLAEERCPAPAVSSWKVFPAHILEQLSAGISSVAKFWAERAVKDRPAAWRRWIKSAATGSAGPAHKWLSKPAVFNPDPLDEKGVPRDPAARVKALAEQYEEIWECKANMEQQALNRTTSTTSPQPPPLLLQL